MRKSYRWSESLEISNADRLLCWAIEHGGFRKAQRLLRLADAAWQAKIGANGADPYDHKHYEACRRLERMYLKRLFDGDLAEAVADMCLESWYVPSRVVKRLAKEAK